MLNYTPGIEHERLMFETRTKFVCLKPKAGTHEEDNFSI